MPEPNEILLANRLRQSVPADIDLEAGGWKCALARRLTQAAWADVRADVERFLERPTDVWMLEREVVLGVMAQRGWIE